MFKCTPCEMNVLFILLKFNSLEIILEKLEKLGHHFRAIEK